MRTLRETEDCDAGRGVEAVLFSSRTSVVHVEERFVVM